jgi:AcrR family transcriptional regulator
MQEALLDAAVDCLVELGFTGTTTTEVTRRAGVSLGAMLHHFPTKADLLAAAVGHVMQRRQDEFRKAMTDIAPSAHRIDAAIDLMWEAFRGPTFHAWLELWVAARTDPELAEAVRVMEDEYDRASREILGELFPLDEYADSAQLELGMRFAVALMDGVALRGLIMTPVDERPVELLKTILHQQVTELDDLTTRKREAKETKT